MKTYKTVQSSEIEQIRKDIVWVLSKAETLDSALSENHKIFVMLEQVINRLKILENRLDFHCRLDSQD